MGSAVLAAVLPPHDGPTAAVPVTMSGDGLAERDGIEAKAIVREQLGRALEIIGQHDPARIATLGGECSVSVAPFSYLARRYGDDVAIVWIDSHPDIGTPRSRYPGGIRSFSPADLRDSTQALLDWVAAAGCSRVAVHFDVDTIDVDTIDSDEIDSDEIVLGLGAEPGGLTGGQARRIVADLDAAVDVVAFTVAEFIPRQVISLQQLLTGFPLISGTVR